MRIKLEHCVLRSWRKGDQKALVRHANNRKIWLNVRDMFPFPYTRRDADQWIRHATALKHPTNCAIEVDGHAVGSVGLIQGEDIYSRSAEVGYWVGEEYWGRGLATEATRAFLDYAFREFDLCRIYATVFEDNHASMRVLEKCGLKLEGRRRMAVVKDGKTIDDFLYAIVREQN
jgi:ribosomal-protein-alanine N-acetyltransferase